jgi:SAM-dependent methyltransferase
MAQTSLADSRTERGTGVPSVLVAIASYGRKQDHFLEQVIAEYRKLTMPCRIVVLSDRPKPVNGAEVLAGLPGRNPYSLPFAHRKLFAENADKYDIFIYTEDDTLLTAAHLDAFLDLQRHLKEDEVVGFIRSETTPEGEQYITSINHSFRWLPETVETRGRELFAQFSNDHSGCFVVTKGQLKRALGSGGFLVDPHDEMYGMLESAASDVYRQCGLTRLLCVSRIHECIIPHLPNKYFAQMGVPITELDLHVRALTEVHARNRWRGALCEPKTRARGFRWSKNLYAMPDKTLLQAVPSGARRLLSVGAGLGRTEQVLRSRGVDVHALAIDEVFAGALRAKGIDAVAGPIDEALNAFGVEGFDVVLVADVLHLVREPVEWLRQLRDRLTPNGWLLMGVPNTGEVSCWMKDARQGHLRWRFPNYASTGVHPVSVRRLQRWCEKAGLAVVEITPLMDEARRRKLGRFGVGLLRPLLASTFLLKATRLPAS